jgi:hypothetical protein
MFQPSSGDTSVSTHFRLPPYQPDRLLHILVGQRGEVIADINHMVALGYCDQVAWSDPMPTGRNGEFISLMNRRIPPRD